MVYPTQLNYECEKCGNEFSIFSTPKYGEKCAKPFLNVRCPDCGGKAHYKNKE